MNAFQLIEFCLVFHIIGIILFAGTTLFDSIVLGIFWKEYATDRQKALGIMPVLNWVPRLFGIGLLLLLASGITMVAASHGAFAEQLWFRIKMGLLLIIIINGLGVGRRQGIRMRKLLAAPEPGTKQLNSVKRNLKTFHIIQLLLFFTLFVLSVYRFN